LSPDKESGLYEESTEELFERAPVGYLAFLSNGRIVRVNRTFLDWTGYEREALLVDKFLTLLTIPGRLYFETTLAPALQMRGQIGEVAFDIVCHQRPALPVLINFSMMPPAGERPTLIRATIFNATERRQYERELLSARRAAEEATKTEQAAREASQRASRVKDDFLAVVSHELRTPLSAILGWTQLLRRLQFADKKLEQGLDVIERNTRVQVQLVDDLLDLSRVISGKMRLNVQRVELAEIVDAAIETARFAAEAREIRLAKVLDPSIVVMGDPGRLQQIFWNLLSNAVKFTPKGGSIRLVMAQLNSHVEISVSDSGQGMTAEFLARAFDRFGQADDARTRASTGLGLGLSIVKQLVEMHGGTIHARSEGPGLGSTFAVHLPLSVLREAGSDAVVYPKDAVAPRPMEPIGVKLKHVKLVIAEDQSDSREVLRQILADAGADVIAVGTASEVLMALTAGHVEVLISDIGLPDMDGYELIRRVRLTAAGATLPAIALTAYSRVEDRALALMAGFQIHLSKPVDPRELVLAVASLAGRLSV
jgi:PAS domain S-box-containing protein